MNSQIDLQNKTYNLIEQYNKRNRIYKWYPLQRSISLTISIVRYVIKFHKIPHLRSPKDLNEKILWFAINEEKNLWAILADKIFVHKYLQALQLNSLSVPILKIWKSADEIDFSQLPNEFVIKTNHGCGDVLVIKDKTRIEETTIKDLMDKAQKMHFGLWTGEPHYLKIKPYIFAEKMLTNDSPLSSSIIDYKFFCFNGIPKCILVCYDRQKLSAQKIVYDMEWNKREDLTHLTSKSVIKDIPKPKNFDRMIDACQKLGAPFKFVRIDFYESNGNPYFGEMTFTPAAGRSTALSQKALDWLGGFININKKD